MPRKIRHSRLESRTSRLKLAPRGKPYTGPALGKGAALLYRRKRTKNVNGSWNLKQPADEPGQYSIDAFAEADDYDNSDGLRILDYFQAQDVAKAKLKAGRVTVTVDAALEAYERDLAARGAYTYNARWPRLYLTEKLLERPVAQLTATELKDWRDSLIGKLAPLSINRMLNAFCAGLELAASHDEHIGNRTAWRLGLAALPNVHRARNVVLSDEQVRAFVEAVYAEDAALGLLVDVLANTGTRCSQAVRLRVGDLLLGDKPRLMMPKSAKGGGRLRVKKKSESFPVPTSLALAAKLEQVARGRAPEEPLLRRSDGTDFNMADPFVHFRDTLRGIVAGMGLDPKAVTPYSLRHSSITRMLLRNVPVRVVATLHDTSIGMIEKTYSRYISDYADDVARSALLQPEPIAENVVALR
jgi:integrase